MFIFTDLNETAQAQLLAIVDAECREGVSRDYSDWYGDIDFYENGAHIEISAFYTVSGNPVPVDFGPEDCVGEEIED